MDMRPHAYRTLPYQSIYNTVPVITDRFDIPDTPDMPDMPVATVQSESTDEAWNDDKYHEAWNDDK